MFSIVIPTLGTRRKKNIKYIHKKRYNIFDCLEAIYRSYDKNAINVVVVANDCEKTEIERIGQLYPRLHLIQNSWNVGVARSWNMGANFCKTNNICFLNDDCVVESTILSQYSQYLNENPDVGIVGPAGSFWNEFEHREYYSSSEIGAADVVSGFCFMTRQTTLSSAGYFDTNYTPAGFEEIDYCKTVRAQGLKNIVWPSEEIKHNIVHGVSGVKQEIKYFDETIDTVSLNDRNREIFEKKWKI